MPSFDTPGPILVTLEIGVGDVRIAASDRSDTNVVVRPSNPTRKSDLAAAEQTRVEFSDGRLLIKAPKGWRHCAKVLLRRPWSRAGKGCFSRVLLRRLYW